VTLHDRPDLAPKPAPDGYIAAMKNLNVKAKNTLVLEDSNAGIASAKAAGAYTVAFRQNLVEGYKQIEKADADAQNLQDVAKIVQNFALQFN